MKCIILYGCLNGGVQLLIFNIFTWFFGGVKVGVQIWDFKKVFLTDNWQSFLTSFMCNQVRSFNVQIIWIDLAAS